MLLGYVSDERYVAIAGAHVEIVGPHGSTATVSRASGAIHADVEAGRYEVILAKDGYGPKRIAVDLAAHQPHHFRLLKDDLLGYAGPNGPRRRGERVPRSQRRSLQNRVVALRVEKGAGALDRLVR